MGSSGNVSAGQGGNTKQASKAQAAAPIITGISTIGDAYVNSEARKAQAEYQEGIYNVDARFAEVQAEDSIARGEFAAGEVIRRSEKNLSIVRQNIKKVTSGQRVAFAGQGVEVNSGSAADILADTNLAGELDANDIKRNTALDVITIKNNAWREAWGFKTTAEIYRGQGRFADLAGRTAARNTILTGATKTLGYGIDAYTKYKMANGG